MRYVFSGILAAAALCALVQACGDANGEDARDPLKMECKTAYASINGSVRRCENAEAVCYESRGDGGISCWAKKS